MRAAAATTGSRTYIRDNSTALTGIPLVTDDAGAVAEPGASVTLLDIAAAGASLTTLLLLPLVVVTAGAKLTGADVTGAEEGTALGIGVAGQLQRSANWARYP
jgi:hypothetical protein